MIVLLKVVDVAGVERGPESHQDALCYCRGAINKNEGNFHGDHVGDCWKQ